MPMILRNVSGGVRILSAHLIGVACANRDTNLVRSCAASVLPAHRVAVLVGLDLGYESTRWTEREMGWWAGKLNTRQ